MTPILSNITLETIRERTDIVEIVSEYVVLKKRGKDYLGLCPFHQEKTPSFSVNPSKQMFYCFGCSAGGDAIAFLKSVNKQSFPEVILNLAQRYNIPVETADPKDREAFQKQLSERELFFELNAISASFFRHALTQKPEVQAYLENRGITQDTINQFQIGYAPAGFSSLYQYMVETKNKSVVLLEKLGLIKRSSRNNWIDVFRDRVIIPIQDEQGRIIGFGGRSLGDEQPKYLNSPDTPLFNKSKTLFALDKAKSAIAKEDKTVVVEGYFDAIALHSVGINDVVASMGTALTLDQIKLLLKYSESKQVILNLDADTAGIKATSSAIASFESLVYAGQMNLKVLALQGVKDADEFIKTKGVDAYIALINQAPSWMEWQINQVVMGKDLSSPDQYQQVVAGMVKLLGKLEDLITRSFFVNHCAQILAQGQTQQYKGIIESLYRQLKRPTSKRAKVEVRGVRTDALLEEAEALLLRIYLHQPEYRDRIIDMMDERDLVFCFSSHRFLWQLILQGKEEFPEIEGEHSCLNPILFNPPAEDAVRTPRLIEGAIACLERVSLEKHKRYCLSQWEKTPMRDQAKRQYYWDEARLAGKRIFDLDALRAGEP